MTKCEIIFVVLVTLSNVYFVHIFRVDKNDPEYRTKEFTLFKAEKKERKIVHDKLK